MRPKILIASYILWCIMNYSFVRADPLTPIHQPGYCSMRGNCGSGLIPLPCVANEEAALPDTSQFRELLVDTCGIEYRAGPVCCNSDQLDTLIDQVKKAENIIASCPACYHNFLQFWCSFTCSPDQSTFVNITAVDDSTPPAVSQVDYWVGENFGSQFYDSCKDIKFGSSNGFAMDFIGGGAKNWHEMITYMGRRRPFLGSPFQIDFPVMDDVPTNNISRYDADGKSCNDTDPAYRCACIDCEAVCPVLAPAPGAGVDCYIGSLTCWSFAMLMLYLSFVAIGLILLLARNKLVGRLTQRLLGINLLNRSDSRRFYERLALSEDDDQIDETLLDPDSTPRRYWLNSRLQNWFYYQGLFCARHPWLVIFTSFIFVSLASLGWSKFSLERDPINLWVSPSSNVLAEKKYFDDHFTPFYRTTQLFLVSETSDPITSGEHLESLFMLEDEIRSMKSDGSNYTLEDVCYHPTGDVCIVQSVTGYWQGDIDNFDPDNWEDELDDCASLPSLCLPEFQLPIKPEMVLGGYENQDFTKSKALIVTYVLQNSVDEGDIARATEWEKTLLEKILNHVNERPEWKGVRISYSTESSLEKELNKSSNTDIKTVIISYVVMFIYASIALGRLSSFNIRRLLIDSKFSLGVCGILIVIFSVSTAVGLFSFTGQKVTLIIAEVIPFLVLAVGVDNIFILCHEYARRSELGEDESIEERAAKTLGKMGPSILLSSLSETIAFGLGAFVTMPAVSSFAIVAAIAVFVDFILQVTCFVSCLVLDAYREKNNRIDCFPCVRIKAPEVLEKEGFLQHIIRHYYVPVILSRNVRYFVCFAFLGLFTIGLSLMPQVSLGLDQRIALPSDSYLVQYFNDMDQYFNVGPPVYFVVKGANLTEKEEQKKICGRFPTCREKSLANILEMERKRPAVSSIGQPASVWMDDFMLWLNPNIGCCRLKNQPLSGTMSKRSTQQIIKGELKKIFNRPDWELCGPYDDDEQCFNCLAENQISLDSIPEGQEFLDFYDLWIDMTPDDNCPLGGKASYGDAIVSNHQDVTIEASHFRTYHTPLRNQEQFIFAHAAAKRIAREMSEELDLEIFPYSVFYVFFEQYSYIVSMALQILGLAIISIFIVTSSLLGSLRCGLIVMSVVIMILIDVVGVMTLWNISLNAVSLVNLVICVGISVEFCCHIARGYMVAAGSQEERAGKSMIDVGSSVFCGITLTKFAGVIVLAFTRSKIFEIYYFRM
ncbi:patched family-domain-containing protein [Pilobolus umbonatus]|nr:patched family-domain-containing protein [Pilobolus umbonatus]